MSNKTVYGWDLSISNKTARRNSTENELSTIRLETVGTLACPIKLLIVGTWACPIKLLAVGTSACPIKLPEETVSKNVCNTVKVVQPTKQITLSGG